MNEIDTRAKELRKELLSRHTEFRKKQERIFKQRNVRGAFSIPKGPIPAPSTPLPIEQLHQITIALLQAGSKHDDFVLHCTILTKPVVQCNVCLFVEDEAGDIIGVAIQYFRSDIISIRDRIAAADDIFQKGKRVAIKEPKVSDESTRPYHLEILNWETEIMFNPPICVKDCDTYYKEGTFHLDHENFRRAEHFFREALAVHPARVIALKLFCNIAASLVQLGKYSSALLFAVSAIIISPGEYTPCFLAGKALGKFGRPHLATLCLERSRTFGAPHSSKLELEALIEGTNGVSCTPQEWNKQVLRIICGADVKQYLLVKSVIPDSIVSYPILEMEKHGSDLQAAGRYEEAIHVYISTLRRLNIGNCIDSLATCEFIQSLLQKWPFTASMGLIISPQTYRFHYLKIEGLEAYKYMDEALNAVGVENILIDEQVSPTMHENILEYSRKQGSKPASLNLSDHRGVASIANQVMTWRDHANRTGTIGMRIDERVPAFPEKFMDGGFWPAQGRKFMYVKLLLDAYENASESTGTRFEDTSDRNQPTTTIRLNRSTMEKSRRSVSRMESWGSEDLHDHDVLKHSCFSRVPFGKRKFLAGTEHVSFGFVDLSSLLTLEIARADANDPLKWTGFDLSAYNTAKTMVIAEMLSSHAKTDHILQAWYSAIWTKGTLKSFKVALQKVRSSIEAMEDITGESEVMLFLLHWDRSSVDLKTARAEWISRHIDGPNWKIVNLRRPMDRKVMCKYIMTGDVLDGSVGSTMMFNLPRDPGDEKEQVYQMERYELFFQGILTKDLVACMDKNTDIMKAAVSLLRARIHSLREKVSSRQLKIDLRHRSLLTEDSTASNEIADLCPDYIYWGDLPDYMEHGDFHNIAWDCSGEDTLHEIFSMNWVLEQESTSMASYSDGKRRAERERWSPYWLSENCGREMEEYFFHPPVGCKDIFTYYMLAREEVSLWVNDFLLSFASGAPTQKGEPTLNSFDILSRESRTVFLQYSY